jgi:hypothetical protein
MKLHEALYNCNFEIVNNIIVIWIKWLENESEFEEQLKTLGCASAATD